MGRSSVGIVRRVEGVSETLVDTPPLASADARHSWVTSPQQEAWRRFRANRLGLLGLVIVVFLLVLAVGAAVIAPFPYDKPDFAAAWQFPSRQHLMGTD